VVPYQMSHTYSPSLDLFSWCSRPSVIEHKLTRYIGLYTDSSSMCKPTAGTSRPVPHARRRNRQWTLVLHSPSRYGKPCSSAKECTDEAARFYCVSHLWLVSESASANSHSEQLQWLVWRYVNSEDKFNLDNVDSKMKMAVFWVLAPCSLLQVNRRFRDAYCYHHRGDE
jgi:hypothetical protein